jgi:hypothetical protein
MRNGKTPPLFYEISPRQKLCGVGIQRENLDFFYVLIAPFLHDFGDGSMKETEFSTAETRFRVYSIPLFEVEYFPCPKKCWGLPLLGGGKGVGCVSPFSFPK